MASSLPVPAAPASRSLDSGPSGLGASGVGVDHVEPPPTPGNHPWRSRVGKIALGLLVAAVGLEGLYVAGANGFFASKKLEGYISSDDGNFALRYEHLRTWIPGRYHVENLTIQSRGIGVQWVLGIDQADFTTNPLTLLKHRFDVSKVTASGVSFRLRTTEPGDKAKREETKGFPPIAGYDDLEPVPPSPPTPLDELWQVSIRNIDAHAREVWTQQFRHVGDMRAQGKFDLTPGLFFDVGPASLEFLGGVVTVGKSTMASSLTGRVDALIAASSIIDPGRSSVLSQVDARVGLDAQIDSVIGWQTFWPAGVTVADGSGQLALRASLTRGMFDGGSTVTYDTRRLVAHDDTVTAVMPLRLEWKVADDGQSSRTHADVSSIDVSRQNDKGEGAHLSGVKATFDTGPLDAAGLWELRHVEAAVGAFEAKDAHFFNVEQLREEQVVLEHGLTKGHGTFVFDAPETVSGDLRFSVEGLTARYSGDPIHAEVAFFGHVPPSRISEGLTISSARLDVRDAFLHANGKKVDHWWARLDAGNSNLEVARRVKFKGPVTLHGKDASLVLAYALDDGGIEGELRDLVNTDHLDAYLDVAAEGQQLDLRIHSVKGGAYEVTGRAVYRGGWCGAVLLERSPLSLGVKMQGNHNSLRPMAGKSWLAEHAGGPQDGQMKGCPLSRRQLHEQREREEHGGHEASGGKGEHEAAASGEKGSQAGHASHAGHATAKAP